MSNDCDEKQTELVQKALAELLPKLNVADYSAEIQLATAKGDNYMSTVYRVQVNHKGERLHFVAKVAKLSEVTRQYMEIRLGFLSEIYFYEKVLPAFESFQTERNVSRPFRSVCKCHHAVSTDFQEVLLFDDLRTMGFAGWNRRETMPQEVLRLVLREYGRYHALSFALRDQRPKDFERLTSGLYDIMESDKMNQDFWQKELRKYYPALELVGGKQAVERMEEGFVDPKAVIRSSANKEDPQSVIIHGDCWCGNFMFKGSSELCLIDFQLQRLGSPVLDVLYFFFTAARGEALSDFDGYMKVYHDSLSEFLTELGSDPDKLFPFEDLMKHVKKYGRYGLLFSILLLRVLLVDTDEVPDLDKLETFQSEEIAEIHAEEELRKTGAEVLMCALRVGIV